MDQDLRKFFVAQRQRVHRVLRTRCGRMGDMEGIGDGTPRRSLQVTVRGSAGHASGHRKPAMEDHFGNGGFMSGKRRKQVLWGNYEQRAGRMPMHVEDEDGSGVND